MLRLLLLAALSSSAPELTEPKLPSPLTLEAAEEIFLAHGLDLLASEAQARGAEGDLKAAGALPNPGVSAAYLQSFAVGQNFPEIGGAPNPNSFPAVPGWTVGLSDSALIEQELTGKRALRIRVAAQALAASKEQVKDLKRNELFLLRQSFATALLARGNLALAHEVEASYDQTYKLNQIRYQKGDISEADLSKIATAKLESDQAVTQAEQGLATAKAALAFLLGVRTGIASFELQGVLAYRTLDRLQGKTPADLLALGFDHRPDLRAAVATRKQNEELVAQARRAVFPDITIAASYTTQYLPPPANNPGLATVVSPPILQIGASAPIPILYQQQGEIRRAESNLASARAAEAKARAQLVSDIAQGWAGYVAARELVERMEGDLLKQAKLSRDLEQLMYQKGAASLLDFLDAERTYIATNLEYHQDLASYWDSVFQLEQATATPLR